LTDTTLQTDPPTPTTHATTSPASAQHKTTPNTSHTLHTPHPLHLHHQPQSLRTATTRAIHHSQQASTGRHPRRPFLPLAEMEVLVEQLADCFMRQIELGSLIQCMSCQRGRRKRRGRGLRRKAGDWTENGERDDSGIVMMVSRARGC
jgi:hypothetical protein